MVVFLLFSKVFVLLIRSRSMHVCSLGMNLGDHTQLLWSHFPELLPLCHLSSVFWFPALFFSVLQSERWGFGYPTLPYISATVPGPSKGQRGRESNETGPILLEPQPHQSERKVLLLQNFESSEASSHCHHHRTVWKLVCNGMKKNKNGFLHSITCSIFCPLS